MMIANYAYDAPKTYYYHPTHPIFEREYMQRPIEVSEELKDELNKKIIDHVSRRLYGL